MGKSTNQRSWDTHVSDSRPGKNYGTFPRLGIWSNHPDGGTTSFAYVSFTRPFPMGAKIISAKLDFRTHDMGAGDHSIYLRKVTERFAFGRVTWDTRPAVTGTGHGQTKSGALPYGEQWSIDITDWMQEVSDGAPWYGIRIATTDNWVRWIFSEDTRSNIYGGPTVTIEWSDQPDEPASLQPDEGVVGTPAPALSFEYLPIDEDATLQMVHVQTSTSESFAVPAWDSGIHAVTEPTVYLNDLGYPGATEGEVVYWRIRVMDQGGWSGWSPVAEFTYIPEPGLTMTVPVEGTAPLGDDSNVLYGYISDTTPQLSWISPGQVAYRITVALDEDSFSAKDWIWDSGEVQSTATNIEIPDGVITRDDVPYRIIVRTYDEHERISVANDHYTYSGARIVVEMTDDPALTNVTNVHGEQIPGTPTVQVTWERATAADEYMLIRDGLSDIGSSRRVLVGKVSHADVVQPDGTFAYVDHGAPPRTPFRYSIYPVDDGKRGTGTLGNVLETRLDGIWLVMPDFSLAIAGDDQGTWALPEQATAHQVIGATSPTIVREVHQGYQGSVSGHLIEEHMYQPGLSAQEKRDRFLTIKEDPRGARLVVADMNIPVRLANFNVYPTPHHDLRYECSFDWWQDDEVWWERL